MDAGQGGRGPSDIATLTAAAVAAVEASAAAGPLPAPAETRESPLLSLNGGANSSREVNGAASNGTPTVVAASVFSAAAAAAGISHTTLPIAATTKPAAAPKRKRLMRLESGELVVIPTNIYRQAGGVKLDITLGGFRIDNEKCTLKNRAYNFGVLPGFTRENLLALRYAMLQSKRTGTACVRLKIAVRDVVHTCEDVHRVRKVENCSPGRRPTCLC